MGIRGVPAIEVMEADVGHPVEDVRGHTESANPGKHRTEEIPSGQRA